ncbi:L-type lectin-domain containing receptor kinase S.4-like [Quercus robur]|uniref:L-type lectin-domain containing receptor kinase S.4-like n=1 Tax=Quercus robur TaxID=38942 RepID=UPI002161FC61|nr:L-type lectin-domain containing receptor kinase S.4-like [Quercus robur]
MLINVSISPLGLPRPCWPLISFPIDLSTVIDDYMYLGFSASTGVLAATHNVHGWSFRIGERAQDLHPKEPPSLVTGSEEVVHRKGLIIRSQDEILEDWEVEYGARRFKQDKLLLVYDYVPNGGLDKILFDSEEQRKILSWKQIHKILIGVAQALLYLHEESEQRVVHRDVKPSNVLKDANLNARLGDFGLPRTYKHGINPQTTHIVGTLGYIAPEFTRTGKATRSTDEYGYGILLLEVACGRRPIEPKKNPEELLLVDWVRELHSQGEIIRAVDPILDACDPDEVELVLVLGLLSSLPHPDHRPSMRRILQILLGDASLPPLPPAIHLEEYRMMEFSNDSDLSSYGMTSSLSSSFKRFDKIVASPHAPVIL